GPSRTVLALEYNRRGGKELQVLVRVEQEGEHQVEVASTKDVPGTYTLSVQRCERTAKADRTEREERTLRARRLVQQGSQHTGKEGFAKARKSLEEALALLEKVYPEERYPAGHLRVVHCRNSLGALLISNARYCDALPHVQRARDSYE